MEKAKSKDPLILVSLGPNTITGQLLRNIFGVFFGIAIVMIFFQVYLEFDKIKVEINKEFKSLETSFGPAIVSALWEANDLALDSILKGISKNNYIKGMKIENESGDVEAYNGEVLVNEESVKNNSKNSFDKQLFFYKFKLKRNVGKQTYILGTVTIYSSNEYIVEKLKSSFIPILRNSIFQILILMFIIFIFLNRILKGPLEALTKAVKNLNPENLSELKVENLGENELGTLQKSFNVLILNLIKSQNIIKIKNRELEDYKKFLSQKVEVRTAELKSSLEETKAANQVKESFLANISHEIRTPLNAIIGFSEIMGHLTTTGKSVDLREYITGIKMSSKNLLSIINNILDISKVRSGKMTLDNKILNFKEMLDDLKDMYFILSQEKGINLTFEYSNEIPKFIVSSEGRLRQIFLNLINNALKFTSKGFIKVSVSKLDYKASKENLIGFQIKVQDTGVGIPQNQMKRIFEPFVQREGQSVNDYGGTGLGLSIIKGILDIMNGSINVESKEGEGTTFIVDIKDIEVGRDIDMTSTKKINHEKVNFEKAKILVADDNELNRRLLLKYLAFYDLEVFTAKDGQECYEIAIEKKPQVILMDINMPVLNGVDSTIKIRADLSYDIKVIAVSASVDEARLKEITHHFDGFIIKPVLLEELVLNLAKFLPYKLIDEVRPKNEKKFEDYLDEPTGDMNLLVTKLEKMKKKWSKVKDTLTINDLEILSEEANKLSDEYKWRPLKEWSYKLSVSVNLFEVDKFQGILEEFPKIIDGFIKEVA